MKILLTGFEPFGEESINPSYEAIKKLKDSKKNLKIIEIPTSFYKSIEKLKIVINKFNPDVVICVGQAGGRYNISIERVAINVNDARIEDNLGNQPIDEKVVESGPNAYFTNLPIKSMVNRLLKSNIPAEVSNSAGTYVCNHLMYGLMDIIEDSKKNIKGGFIHVPFTHDQVINKKNQPSLALETITEAFELIIDFLNNENLEKDLDLAFGKEN